MRWGSFVALGDSFTEGLDDPHPSGIGYRGWADLVAGRLSAHHRVAHPRTDPDESAGLGWGRVPSGRIAGAQAGGFQYANLAVRGRLFEAIVAEQVPVAVQMRPNLVSFAGGGNDVLRRRFDPAAMLARFDRVVARLRGAGADVLLFRFADLTSRLPAGRLILSRVELLNRAVGEVAHRYGATLVDLWQDDEFTNPLLWSDDRLHLSSAGHRRVAAHVLTTLGLAGDPEWLAPVRRPPRRSWLASRAQDARWAGQHLAPWVHRRLTGRSSGDALRPKRPTLSPFDDEA